MEGLNEANSTQNLLNTLSSSRKTLCFCSKVVVKNYGNVSFSFSAARPFLMKERSWNVEGQGSALLSVSNVQQF